MSDNQGGMGQVILNGIAYPVTGLRLCEGATRVTFEMRGPVEPFESPITIIGEDGQGCWQGSVWRLERGLRRGEIWACHYDMHVAIVFGSGYLDPQ